jgi:hypothetical protein
MKVGVPVQVAPVPAVLENVPMLDVVVDLVVELVARFKVPSQKKVPPAALTTVISAENTQVTGVLMLGVGTAEDDVQTVVPPAESAQV